MEKEICVDAPKKRKRVLLKIFIAILSILVILFAVINILWFIRDAKLKKLCTDKYEWEIFDDSDVSEEIEYSYDPDNLPGEIDNIFSVDIPRYPGAVSWISVVEVLVLDDDMKTYIGDYAVDVQVKKHTFFPTQYIVQVCDLKEASKNGTAFFNQFYINPDLSLLENKYYTYTDEEKAIFEKCHEKIKSQVKELEEFFGKPIDKLV